MGALKKKTGVAYAVNAVLVVILFVVLLVLIDSGTLNRYNTTIITNLCINVILAVSLNLVTGILGQLVLGHAGFMLAGAYAAALFTKNIGLPLSISLPIGLVLGGLLAAVLSSASPPCACGGTIWRSSPWASVRSSGWCPSI